MKTIARIPSASSKEQNWKCVCVCVCVKGK